MAQGNGNGAVVRMLASHHRGLSMIPRPGITCGLSLLLILLLAPRVFLQVLLVSLLHKNGHFQFIFDLGTVEKMSHLVECPLLNYYSCYHKIIFLIFLKPHRTPYLKSASKVFNNHVVLTDNIISIALLGFQPFTSQASLEIHIKLLN